MKRLSIFALGLLLCIGTAVNAQQKKAISDNKNGKGGDWESGSTWKGPIPSSGDIVSIVNGGAVTLNTAGKTVASLAISNGSLVINNNGSLTATNGTTISGGTLTNYGTISGGLTVSDGTLTNSGTINGNLTVSGGTVNINQGSSITGAITIDGGTVNIAAGAVVDFTNATITGGTVEIVPGAVVIGYQGEQSISISLTANKWNFIGFPHVENISPLAANGAPSIWALAFDYGTNQWTENYLHWIDGGQHDALPYGQGIFAWPATDYTITASSVVTNENRRMTYSSTAGSEENGRWFALANPFSFPLDITKFLNANPGIIQGGCVYKYNGSTFDENVTSGTIKVGQGFFVNMASNDGQIQFNNDQYSTSTAKSKSAEREFVRVSVSTEGYKVPVMFAQNDDASDGYDIFDANKMFGDGSVAEPYLICNGINLCKEEVLSSSYTATMNIKSFESRSVEIVADNIPEGYSLTLIDGAVEVAMSEGDVYTTDIAEGENAERFKLLINKNNVSIADVAEAESIRVVNNNRTISIYGGNDVRTEVYNALGQKVYETSDRVFDLNNVASGAYILKVSDGKTVNSTKIVVE